MSRFEALCRAILEAGLDGIEALPKRFTTLPVDAARVKAYIVQHVAD